MSTAVAERPVPASIEAEHALLGCVLQHNEAFLTVSHLQPESFREPVHSAIWAACAEMINGQRMANVITVMERLKGDPRFQEMGGIKFLADLVDYPPPALEAPEYARVIQDLAIRRELITFGAAVTKMAAAEDGQPALEVLAGVRRGVETIEASRALDDASMIDAPAAAAAALATMATLAETGKARGRMTGLRCVDRRLGGLRSGALIVLGGRPSMGKTALARAMASGAATHTADAQFLFLGIEMGPEEMMQRELSARSFVDGEGVEYRAMGAGKVTPMDLMNLGRAQKRIPSNLILDDCATLGLEDVRRKVWSRKRHGHVGAVFIDYLQLMRRPKAEGRNEASVLGEITGGLKQIARQSGTCIVLLSQLSRQVEYRDDKRPQLSDLRESGSIEQDADAVLFPYREIYYEERKEPKGGNEKLEWEMRCADLRTRLDVICAKQRQGPVGTDRQVYHAEYDHIEDEKEDRR